MSDVAGLKKDLSRRMEGAVEVLHKEFTGLRTGRASVSLLEPVMVEAYGVPTPLNQVASVSVPESRMLSVQVWDKSMVKSVEKAIRESGLGLNPAADGTLVRVPIPALNEERRAELSKVAGKYAEQAKVSVRNVRRDGMDQLKKWEKDGDISKDEMHNEEKEVQKLTDKVIGEIDEALSHKEQEIMQV
ncbi:MULTISPECIES: ribosome recycling factor [Thalassospira]|uniref:Ribosome-recycling factor n=1 Tax=Thalassospira profundimaris TaxID=502049 RepID=A0A367V5K7_9PROT|nr:MULTISPECIES: ribosome recycling factor [Thalassospira]MBR9899986.1 ribosome recycling factor [Rhodospirillales bacterium]MBS8272945.1 ribosome recycling factor [Thalassospira tepidiphila]KZB72785.1 ribosome recycling factor [Thalassospira sp. MCCC 1A01148]MBC44365.1 ribosome-recycling factor [Thalassospira sp.]MBO6807085.1 ribosome recycling factor [Thalassospira sp.]